MEHPVSNHPQCYFPPHFRESQRGGGRRENYGEWDSASQEDGWKDQRGTEPKVTSEVVMLEEQEYHVLGEEVKKKIKETAALAQKSLRDRVKLPITDLREGEEDTSWGRRTPHPRELLF